MPRQKEEEEQQQQQGQQWKHGQEEEELKAAELQVEEEDRERAGPAMAGAGGVEEGEGFFVTAAPYHPRSRKEEQALYKAQLRTRKQVGKNRRDRNNTRVEAGRKQREGKREAKRIASIV